MEAGTPEFAELQKYIKEVLGETLSPVEWQGGPKLPFYLRDAYRFFTARLLGHECRLMLPTADDGLQPKAVKKHWLHLQKIQDLPVCLVANHLASYQRRSLVEQRVPFIAANKQLFLLPLGIDLREHHTAQGADLQKPLSPTAQLILLKTLYAPDRLNGLSATELANRLGVTAMTASRATRELGQRKLLVLETAGRARRLQSPEPRKTIWERAKPILRSPVRKRLFGSADPIAGQGPHLYPAGETALSAQTMLGAPQIQTFALAEKHWPQIRDLWTFREVRTSADADLELELWRYDPRLLAVEGRIDPLSLLLSLHDAADERVAIAMDELEATIPWLT